MNIVREIGEEMYLALKPLIFRMTRDDPEYAHQGLIKFAQLTHALGLERFLFDCKANKIEPDFEISNAAGLNKNGDIPLSFFKYLGFDRAVIGTITWDAWLGNDLPRIKRYPETESLVNWMGLPGVGALRVKSNLEQYANCDLPITINIMSTPKKEGSAQIDDVAKSTRTFADFPNVDRIELNPSCPNTRSRAGGSDARRENQKHLGELICAVNENKRGKQRLYVKVSPDLDKDSILETFEVLRRYNVDGIVATNTTTHHEPQYIPKSPGKGGASGEAVWVRSLVVQKEFYELIKKNGSDMDIIACGGISSVVRVVQRCSLGARGIQVYTPLIFKGPRLVRELRMMDAMGYS